MTHVMACIDGSPSASAVCDYAAWASERLRAPLTLLHVLDHHQYPVKRDLSGNIGLGSREHLLDALASLDEKRAKLALEQGRHMLDAAKDRIAGQGGEAPALRQRHGDLVETLASLETDIRLLVMGRKGETSKAATRHIGSHIESVIRTLHRPILITPERFSQPQSVMLAFDGSATTCKGVNALANSPLFESLPVHVVAVGADTGELRKQLEWAQQSLSAPGREVQIAACSGDVESALHAYQAKHNIDMLVMGAYGHSRIRQFLIGSTTTNLLRTSNSPLLILR